MTVQLASSTAEARKLDDQFPSWRDRFHLPQGSDGQPAIYLCGHSLGLEPKATRTMVEAELDRWAQRGVHGHFEGEAPWYSYHESLSAPMADIVGARASEVVLMNSLTTNLHLLMVSFYRPTADRYQILTEADAFPSDRFALESQVRFHGHDPRSALLSLSPRPGEDNLRTADILERIDSHGPAIALVLLSGVNFVTGQALDVAAITAAARKAGCLVGWDLAHAAGNVSLCLHDWDVDFAVWCTYKYLNCGPGAVGAAFVHDRHARRPDFPRFAGWWGHDPATRFAHKPEFLVQQGAAGWQLSNAPVLSMACARASLALFAEAGMTQLRKRSERLSGYLLDLLSALPADFVEILTPKNPAEHGAQVSIRLRRDPRGALGALERAGVVADYREPGIIRLAPVPLYNTFEEVWRCSQILASLA
ncbi:MAG: kynureninase [Cyanobacteria bacterium REEB65]|nr:kynureninase [Cyanobacteria bacterium REEB65]